MTTKSFNPAKTGLSRVFLVEGRARPDHVPAYQNAMRMGGVSQAFGDVERIEVPSPSRYGEFVEVGSIRGARDRAETTLEGRYALDLISEMLRLARAGCALDIQLHMGKCQNPSNFNDFTKALILEDAVITNYSTEDLGSLSSGDEAAVNESVDISARSIYEIMQMNFAKKAESTLTVEVLDVAVCGNQSCGDCDAENGGCDHLFAITKAAGGSPGTPPDLVYSLDGGTTWYAHDIEELTSAQDPSALACDSQYILIVSNTAGSLTYVPLADITATADPDFTETTTGFVAGGAPNDLVVGGSTIFIVGDGGYIYYTLDPTAGVTVADAGAASTDKLLAVDALSDSFAVAVGQNGFIVKTDDGLSWAAVEPRPLGAGIHLNAIALKNEKEWLIGTSTGKVYYTNDGGVNFTEKTFTGSGAGVVYDIHFATDSIVYLSHATAAPLGRILRSYDGGNTFNVLPEGSASMPDNDRFTALAVCDSDPNFVLGGGLGANATDGILVVGKANK